MLNRYLQKNFKYRVLNASSYPDNYIHSANPDASILPVQNFHYYSRRLQIKELLPQQNASKLECRDEVVIKTRKRKHLTLELQTRAIPRTYMRIY